MLQGILGAEKGADPASGGTQYFQRCMFIADLLLRGHPQWMFSKAKQNIRSQRKLPVATFPEWKLGSEGESRGVPRTHSWHPLWEGLDLCSCTLSEGGRSASLS